MAWYWTALITAAIIVLSAFFVVIEFSLLAARRQRLEETAGTSRSSRAALRAMNELTLMLAGAQLGITAATFALGAITKPAVQSAISPLLEMLNLPSVVADGVAFALAMFIVTFLHLVIGEMAPKSWAITHPEQSAKMVAIPANAYITAFRWLLTWINDAANRLVERAGAEPVYRAAARGYDSETLHNLIEHSTEMGTLDEGSATQISQIIRLEHASVGELIADRGTPATTVPHDATVGDIQRAALDSGHFRILIEAGPGSAPSQPHLVHVRDTLMTDPSEPVSSFARQVAQLGESARLQEALDLMRSTRSQFVAIIPDEGDPRILGVVTAADLLGQIWPSIRPAAQPETT